MVVTCADCQHLTRAKPYTWGICECPTPWWIIQLGEMIQPDDKRATRCDCFSSKQPPKE